MFALLYYDVLQNTRNEKHDGSWIQKAILEKIMTRHLPYILLALVVLAMVVPAVSATTIVLHPINQTDAQRAVTNETLSVITSGGGSTSVHPLNNYGTYLKASKETPNYTTNERPMFTFDLSSLPAFRTITAIKLSLWGWTAKPNSFGGSPGLVIVNASPTNASAMTYLDYNKTGNVILATNYTFAGFSQTNTSYSNTSFTPTGISYVSNRGSTNITIAALNSADFNKNLGGTWVANGVVAFYFFGAGGAGVTTYDPLLTIDYTTTPDTSFTKSLTNGQMDAPLTYQLTDTSTLSPTGYSWSYTNTSGNNTEIVFNTTSSTPLITLGAGNWLIKDTASNGNGAGTTSSQWINISYSSSDRANLAGITFFPPDHIYNTRIDTLPIATNSSNFITANYGSAGKLIFSVGNPSDDPPDSGWAYDVVDSNAPKYDLVYPDSAHHDISLDENVPIPLPLPRVLQQIQDGTCDVENYDCHAFIIDRSTNMDYELYGFSGTQYANTSWQIGSNGAWDLSGYSLGLATHGSSSVSGMPLFPLMVRYDEIQSGSINHALTVAIPWSRTGTGSHIYPATMGGGNGNNATTNYPPIGQRFRLNASFNISGYSATNRIILTAMKQYGFFVTDNGAQIPAHAWELKGLRDPRWSIAERDALNAINGTSFEAVDESSLMISADSGKVNSTVNRLGSYRYVKTITANNPGTTQGRYQFNITIHNTPGTDTATDIYLESVRPDWADVQVTDSLNNNLSFVMLDPRTVSTTLWWDARNIPTGVNYFNLWYGAPNQTVSNANGDNTFPFLDDFNEPSLNTSRWTVYATGVTNQIDNGGSFASGNVGYFNTTANAPYAWGNDAIVSKAIFDRNANPVSATVKWQAGSTSSWIWGFGLSNITTSAGDTTALWALFTNSTYLIDGSYNADYFGTNALTTYRIQTMNIRLSPGGIWNMTYNGTDKGGTFVSNNLSVLSSMHDGKMLLDYIYVRNYTGYNVAEPAVSSVSASKDYAPLSKTVTLHIVSNPTASTADTRILPFGYIPPITSGGISLNVTPNAYAPMSFIIRSNDGTTSNIAVSISNLVSGGNTIPASAIDTKLVKAWWQAGNESGTNDLSTSPHHRGNSVLIPELLIHDDNLIRVDYWNKSNALYGTVSGVPQYINISGISDAFPESTTIEDAATLQPFSLQQNENRQVWATLHVPNGTPTGNYTGTFTVSDGSGTLGTVPITVRVLPFTLPNASVTFGVYYTGYYYSASTDTLGSQGYMPKKTAVQYAADMEGLKEHGILYPNMYDSASSATLSVPLQIRRDSGLPQDRLFALSISAGSQSTEAQFNALNASLIGFKNNITAYGFNDFYVYGLDEVTGDSLANEITAWTIVHSQGGKVFVACNLDSFPRVGTVLDVAIRSTGGYPNTTEVALWHSVGHQIFEYGNPQGGTENPDVMRRSYGYTPWAGGYDGVMTYAYQGGFGTLWNDFDDYTSTPMYYYRDHNLAYPTSTIPIDTIQYEGTREGIYDTQIADTLSNITGNRTEALTVINAGIAAGSDMSVIRATLIDHILAYGDSVVPTASFTKNRPLVVIPQSMSVTDTSTNTPTSWNWSWGDGTAWVNGTANSSVHTYTAVGNYTITLVVSNAAGSSTATDTIQVTRNDFSGIPISGASPLSVQFTNTSSPISTTYVWAYKESTGIWTQFATTANPSHVFGTGTYSINMTTTFSGGSDSMVKTDYIQVGAHTSTAGTPWDDYRNSPVGFFTSAIGLISLLVTIIVVAIIFQVLTSDSGTSAEVAMGLAISVTIGIVIIAALYMITITVGGMIAAI